MYSTREEGDFVDTVHEIERMVEGKRKLSHPGDGRSRPIGVVQFVDLAGAQAYARRGQLKLPEVGYVWPSTKAAALDLGVSPASLCVLFSRARRAADGIDSKIVVRGIQLAFTNRPGWQDASGKPVRGEKFVHGKKNTTFEERSKAGKRLSMEETATIFKSEKPGVWVDPNVYGPMRETLPKAGEGEKR